MQIDKKYRETIPDVISSMRQLVDSSDEARKKRRRSAKKKMKLGKNGLYTNEDDRVRQWWTANKPELGAGGTDDGDGGPTSISMEQVKAHTSLLRTRETHLQMIVIMEVLALEPLRPRDQPADGGGLPTLPGGETTDLALQPQPAPTPKKRNKHNLPVLLDVHADRLTIWQSTWSDEQILLQDSQVPSQPGNESQLQQKASSEPLRDFCVDVIVPLYAPPPPPLPPL